MNDSNVNESTDNDEDNVEPGGADDNKVTKDKFKEPDRNEKETVQISKRRGRPLALNPNDSNDSQKLGCSKSNQLQFHQTTVNSEEVTIPTEIENSTIDNEHLGTKEALKMEDDMTSKELQDESKNKEVVGKYKCKQCIFETSCKDNLVKHVNGDHKDFRIYFCEDCEYSTTRTTSLRNHKAAIHKLENRRFKCEECPFTSATKASLNYHRVCVHKIGDKQFKCELCIYASASKGNLKKHIEGVHLNPRNHICEYCGYAASVKGYLKRHMQLVHEEAAKKFKCDMCPYAAKEQRCLRRHKSSAHEI